MLPSNASEWETANPRPPRRGPRIGGLVVTLVLVFALAAVIAFAINRLPTSTGASAAARPAPTASAPQRPASTAAPAAAAAAGAPADATTQQAVQDVIRRLDDAQAQAIATGNQQLMAPTATPEFYAQEVSNNQDLVANGVTEVKLLNMEWGQITINGNSAQATVYETWSTTFDDGTTEQARDRNVYTLVKDNSGKWLVQADDHPDQPTAPAPTQ